MRALVVGGGGREHALAWSLSASPLVSDLLAAPGNAGIEQLARCIPVEADDLDGIVRVVESEDVELTVVGPEAPLVAGLADRLGAAGRLVFGPSKAAARLEGSKAWAKEIMQRHRIPTARAQAFTDLDKAVAFVDELGGVAVIKADGLAAGKGVTVASDRDQALQALENALVRGAFGAAGSTVLVEEMLEGRELSAFALSDGERAVPLGLSQDFKRAGDGDEGPNTGGMGAYSPVPWLQAEDEREVWRIVRATISACAAEGSSYSGLLYAGLILTDAGPKVLEFNCRFGDPETQAVLPRLSSDLAELLLAGARGRLDLEDAVWSTDESVTVVMASGGYPGEYETGKSIHGLKAAAALEGITVFHAGTSRVGDEVLTAGGRVLAVSALGSSLAQAHDRAYDACARIEFEGAYFRRDIGLRAAAEEGEGA
jgi:phosphoribosylamine--glycine ligase